MTRPGENWMTLGQPYAPITIPEGASFKDIVALKGKGDIGDQINLHIITRAEVMEEIARIRAKAAKAR